jgi:hypothetical protein
MFAAGLRGEFEPPLLSPRVIRQLLRRYLKTAQKRLNAQLDGIKLDPEDVYAMQMMCPYEVHNFPIQVYENRPLTNGDARPSQSDIPSSASSLPSKSGKGSITRRDHQQTHCSISH